MPKKGKERTYRTLLAYRKGPADMRAVGEAAARQYRDAGKEEGNGR